MSELFKCSTACKESRLYLKRAQCIPFKNHHDCKNNHCKKPSLFSVLLFYGATVWLLLQFTVTPQVYETVQMLFEAEGLNLVDADIKTTGEPLKRQLDACFVDHRNKTLVIVEAKIGDKQLSEMVCVGHLSCLRMLY
jgi:hypothetical protein